MSTLNDKARIFLLHIEDEFKNLNSFTKDVDFDKYQSTKLIQYGIHKSLENIGEACRHIGKNDESCKEKFPAFDFKGLIGFKNKINHDYFAIDYDEVWGTLKYDIPQIEASFYSSFSEDLKILVKDGHRTERNFSESICVNNFIINAGGTGLETGTEGIPDSFTSESNKEKKIDDPSLG